MSKYIAYSDRLGEIVASRAKQKKLSRFHVISSSDKNAWTVVKENSLRSIRRFSTQKAAIAFAKQYAQPSSVDKVIVHDKYGRVQSVIAI
jgi:hypothetical protein